MRYEGTDVAVMVITEISAEIFAEIFAEIHAEIFATRGAAGGAPVVWRLRVRLYRWLHA